VNAKFDLKKFSHLPNLQNPWIKPYWFRTEFQVPSDYKGKTIHLNFDGINYRADVWLNGKLIANAKDVVCMFRRFHFDVSSLISLGKKKL
jgi:exo-1,4-beta-D-glucosaminidase